MEDKQEMLELLAKIEKANRRQTVMTAIICVCALVTAVCFALTFGALHQLAVQAGPILTQVSETIPMITETIPKLTGVISQMQTVMGNLESATEQLSIMDLGEMAADVDALVVTGQKSLEQTMKKLESIDIESLNKAIRDLAAIVEPLAKLTGAFR